MLGLLIFSAYALQTEGIQLTSAGTNAFLTSVYCIFVPFLHWLFTKEKPNRFHLLAAILCVAGIALVSLKENLRINAGDLLTLAGGIFFALHYFAPLRAIWDNFPIFPLFDLKPVDRKGKISS